MASSLQHEHHPIELGLQLQFFRQMDWVRTAILLTSSIWPQDILVFSTTPNNSNWPLGEEDIKKAYWQQINMMSPTYSRFWSPELIKRFNKWITCALWPGGAERFKATSSNPTRYRNTVLFSLVPKFFHLYRRSQNSWIREIRRGRTSKYRV